MDVNLNKELYHPPSVSQVRLVWTLAGKGDTKKKEELLNILMRYETVDAFVNAWLIKRGGGEKAPGKKKKAVRKPSKASSQWERDREKMMGSKSAWPISGGLPSLGKRAK